MKNSSEPSYKYIIPLLQALLLSGLYLTGIYSYLLFHSIAEVFSVVIGFSIFALIWNSRQYLENDYFLFIGIAYLFVSGLDLVHALAYKGMGVFAGYDANLPTQLWIAARYLQSISLLASFIFLRRKLDVYPALSGYAVIAAILIWSIFVGLFPDCFMEGTGLTWFKKISEYVISTILIASIGLLIKNRKMFDENVLGLLIVSLVLTAGSELALTFYSSVYGLSNLIGHFFKIAAIYFIYKAIVVTGIKKPHDVLYRELRESESELKEALEKMEILAVTDSLTGLYNRRHFFHLAGHEFQRSRRYHHPLSAFMIDIDHFKNVNDTYGHAVGDEVLQKVAECLRRELRKVDIACRYGGEEFSALLPESSLSVVCMVAERLRKSISMISLETNNGEVKITASIGVAAVENGNEFMTLESLLNLSDAALYKAKESGRDRVCRNI